jgi:hypothetical protein
MTLRSPLILAVGLVAAVLCADTARADIVVPERDACSGKKVGDACDGGTCVSAGFECQAGSCRRHGDEAACRADGCSWEEQIVCAPAPTATSTTPDPATTTTTPAPVTPPGGCGAGCSASGLELGGVAALLALLRRRRRA